MTDMVTAIFGTLKAGIELWTHKDKMKYLEEVLDLEQKFYEEDNREIRDNSVLDRLEFRLCILAQAFAAQVSATNVGVRQKTA